MYDKWKYYEIDKAMSEKLEAIFSDPKRHTFQSCHDAQAGERGVRGGKIRGLKKKCFHCGNKEKGHAEITENL